MLRIDHVQIAAPPGCEAAARAFFAGLLGLVELPKPDDGQPPAGAWFQLGDRELHVGVDPDFRPSRKGHVGIGATDGAELDALAARLDAAGFPVRWDTRLPGARRFFTEDPWGNRVEILARHG